MEVSNADRVVFPADDITKGEVVAYYEKVGEHMLPFVSGRALTVERFPKGIGEKGFMQKNAPDHYPEDLIARHEVPKEGGGTTVYPVIDTVEAILYYANLGVITFHVPSVLVDDVEHPDWAVWDLDPPPGRVDLVREAAGVMREALEGFGIPTVPMTSGSKGYHVRARLDRAVTTDAVADLARGTAALAAAAHGDLLTLAFKKADRGDRVFVDWLRNHPYSTSVAPWSLRAREGAPVAAPLTWDEVEKIDPDGVRLGDIDVRLRLDPWAGIETMDLSNVVDEVSAALDASGVVLEPFDRFRS